MIKYFENGLLSDWNDLIEEQLLKSQSLAIGVFNTNGNLLGANSMMCYFLDADPISLKPNNFLVNPEIQVLTSNNQSDIIFEGMMTIGNRGNINYALNSKVFKRNDQILIFGETNIPLLFEENDKMSVLNQEVNNLQRQLIKEKKNLQNILTELRDTQQMLIHSEKMNAMGKLVAGVAHELNNPISFVYSNMFTLEKNMSDIFNLFNQVEMLISQNADETVKKKVSEILENNELLFLKDDVNDIVKESRIGIERIKTIVEDLRKFSRLDESEVKIVNILDNLKSTFTFLRSEISNKNIHFSYEIPDINIECYPGQLNQAIINILINAIQSVEVGGNISIKVKEENDFIVFFIQDDGIGIPNEIKDRIFEPFFTTKPVGSGTGLGLSITYKIIHDLHHGSIDVQSELGKGTLFTLTIPKKIK